MTNDRISGVVGAVLLVIEISLSGCNPGVDMKGDIAAGCPGLPVLSVASASNDAARASKVGNKKLLAVRGYSLEIPGVSDVSEAKKKYGVSIIPGTSDAITNKTCGKLNQMASAYAANYNKAILALTP